MSSENAIKDLDGFSDDILIAKEMIYRIVRAYDLIHQSFLIKTNECEPKKAVDVCKNSEFKKSDKIQYSRRKFNFVPKFETIEPKSFKERFLNITPPANGSNNNLLLKNPIRNKTKSNSKDICLKNLEKCVDCANSRCSDFASAARNFIICNEISNCSKNLDKLEKAYVAILNMLDPLMCSIKDGRQITTDEPTFENYYDLNETILQKTGRLDGNSLLKFKAKNTSSWIGERSGRLDSLNSQDSNKIGSDNSSFSISESSLDGSFCRPDSCSSTTDDSKDSEPCHFQHQNRTNSGNGARLLKEKITETFSSQTSIWNKGPENFFEHHTSRELIIKRDFDASNLKAENESRTRRHYKRKRSLRKVLLKK